MYGLAPGLLRLLHDKKREEAMGAPLPTSEPAEFGDEMGHSGFTFALKKKRRALMIKKMLADAGYEDLARNVNIQED